MKILYTSYLKISALSRAFSTIIGVSILVVCAIFLMRSAQQPLPFSKAGSLHLHLTPRPMKPMVSRSELQHIDAKPYVESTVLEMEEAPEEEETDGPREAIKLNNRLTQNPALGYPTPENLQIIRDQYKNRSMLMSSPGSNAIPWVERGPKNVAGRTRAIMVDPNDPTHKTIWAAGVSGGLWKTTDITATSPNWTPINDTFVNMAITCLAYDSTNNDTMYFGTGEVWYNEDAVKGFGIWRSVDKGVTWSQLPATTGLAFNYINKIVVHPTNHKVYVATKDGIYLSANAGNSFTRIGYSSKNISDIELAYSGRIHVGLGSSGTISGYHYTDNDGSVWDPVSNNFDSLIGTADRVELAIAPSNNSILYALVGTFGAVKGIYKSVNGGVSWTATANPAWVDQSCASTSPDFTRDASWYNLAIAVNPGDADQVIIGGVDLLKSGNGGSSWTQITSWTGGCSRAYVHADQHIILFEPGSSTVAYFGNDGGVYRTTNATATIPTITERNTNYNVTQFYACAPHPASGSNVILAGSQDNGTQRFSSSGVNATSNVLSGDGAYCFIDKTNPNITIGSSVYNNYYLSTNGGVNFTTSLVGSSNTGLFINPAAYDHNKHILYSSKDAYSIWRVKNVTTTPTSGQSVSISNMGDYATHLRVSPYTTNSTTLFIGTGVGQLFKVINADTTTTTTTEITGSNFPQYSSISCVELGANENQIMVTFSNYGVTSVWYTANGGSTWVSKEGDLPDMPVRWAMFNPYNRNEAILATELGVWATTNFNDAYPNWLPSNSGLANVRVDMLQMRESDTMLFAATHGRGLFSSKGFSAAPVPAFTASTREPCVNQVVTLTDTSLLNPTSWYWSITPSTYSFVGSTTANSQNPQIKFTAPGQTYQVSLQVTNGFGTNTLAKNGYITTTQITSNTVSGPTASCYGASPVNLTGSAPVGGAGITQYGYKVNEDFNGSLVPSGWTMVLNQNSLLRTDTFNSYSRQTTKGNIRADNFNRASGSIARLNTKQFAPTPAIETLRFDVAHAPYPTITDSMIVYATNNGTTFQRIKAYASSQVVDTFNGITTANPITTLFTPTATQWTTKTLALPVGTIQVRFEFYSGYGNSIYLDRVSVDSFAYPINYLWQNSTTSATQGFVNASGTNNNRNYVSGALTQNTWFRRVVTSGPCTSDTSSAVLVSVNSLPTAQITPASSTTFCLGNSVTLNANTGTGLTYQWRLNGANISGANSGSYVASQAGNYKVVVTNSNGCTDSSSAVTVVVNSLPSASITAGSSTTFCQGSSVTLSANPGTGLTYQWRWNGTNISGATNITYVASVSGDYKVVVTNGNGCSDSSAATTVLVNPLPLAMITPMGSTSLCNGDSVILNAFNLPGYSVQWRRNGANITGANNFYYTAKVAGNYKVVVTNSNNCVDSSAAEVVVVNPIPTASFSTSNTCHGLTTPFLNLSSVSSGSIASNQWFFGDGNTATTTNPTHTYANPGTYTVKLKVTTAAGCSDSTTQQVTIYNRPQVNFTAPAVCMGYPTLFTNTSNIASGSLSNYAWNFGDGNTSNALNPSNLYASSGTYQVTLKVTSNNGCVDSFSRNVLVYPPQQATLTPVGSTTFCQGGQVLLKANVGAGLTYVWKKDGLVISGAVDSNYTATQSGVYKVIVTNANSCFDSSNAVVVTVNPLPLAQLTANGSVTFCQGDSVILKAKTNIGYSYRWRKNNIDLPGSTDSFLVVKTSGTYKLMVTNTNGCIDSSNTMTITVNALPLATAAAIGATTFCDGDSVVLKANTGAGLSWQWRKDFVNIAGANDSVYTAKNSGSFKVIVTNNNGCKDSSQAIAVTANPLPTTPVITRTGFQLSTTATTTPLQWYRNDTAIVNATGQNYNVTVNGSYQLKITDANGCSSWSNKILINNVGWSAQQVRYGLTTYPNPAQTVVYLQLNIMVQEGLEYVVYNSTGQLVLSGVIQGSLTSINIASLASGMYAIRVGSEEVRFVKD